MNRLPPIYRSGLVTRTTSKRAQCAGCGADLGVRRLTTTGLPSTVAATLAEWLHRDERCLTCLRRAVR